MKARGLILAGIATLGVALALVLVDRLSPGGSSESSADEQANPGSDGVQTIVGDLDGEEMSESVSETLAKLKLARRSAQSQDGPFSVAHRGLATLLMTRLFEAAANGEDIDERLHTFRMQIVGVEEVSNLRRLWLELTELEGASALERQIKQIILERWAQLDGPESIEVLLSSISEDDIYSMDTFSGMLRAWVETDPLTALEWYHGEAQDDLVMERGYRVSSDFYNAAFGSLFVEDKETAFASVAALDHYADAEAAVRGMSDVANNPGQWLSLFEGLEAVEDLPNQEALIAVAYEEANLPQQAAEWVEAIPNQNVRIERAKSVAQLWLRQDPDGAANWLYGQAQSRPDAAQIMSQLLGNSSPTAYEEWAARNNVQL